MSDIAATIANLDLAPAFAGYTIGAVLFGVTLLQAYHYFSTAKGTTWQKISVGIILILDTLHFAFAIHMLFTFLLTRSKADALELMSMLNWVVWSLKAMGSTQVVFIIFIQALYFHKIWMFSRNVMLTTRFRRFLKGWVVFLSFLALGVGILFLIELQKIKELVNFSLEFEYVIYVGFGTVCLIDLGIAVAMCLMLYYTSNGVSRRTNMLVTQLIQYIVGTGLLTSLSALMCMVLYIAQPTSLLYLGVEYSNTRLYAISILAFYNSQSRLRDEFNEPRDLASSQLHFAHPDKYSRTGKSELESGLETRSLECAGHQGRLSRRSTADPERFYRGRSRRSHRKRTSSMPDTSESLAHTPDSADSGGVAAMNVGRRYVFHEQEETLVQESPITAMYTQRLPRPPRHRTV